MVNADGQKGWNSIMGEGPAKVVMKVVTGLKKAHFRI